MKKIAVCVVLLVVAGVACSSDDALADMELRREGGSVSVLRDGEVIKVDGRLELKPGDVIKTEPDALASFALEGGADARRGQLQEDSEVLVVSSTSVETRSGELLMEVSEPTRASVEGITARATDAAFRIDRAFGSVRAGVYAGSVQLDAPGQSELVVDRLYQATIVAGELPSQTRPYRLDEEDDWDRNLLAAVVDMEADLQDLARGLSNQLGRRSPTLNYFGALVDGDVRFMRPYLRRPAPDLMIGFTIARNDNLPLGRSFRKAFELRDDGARWGIAASILEVEPKPVIAQLERLILGTQVLAADGTSNPAQFTVAAAAASDPGGPQPGAPGGPSDPGTQPPPGSGGDPPPGNNPGNDPGNDPPPPDECQNTAQCAVQDLEDQLPGPEPSPTPTGDRPV